ATTSERLIPIRTAETWEPLKALVRRGSRLTAVTKQDETCPLTRRKMFSSRGGGRLTVSPSRQGWFGRGADALRAGPARGRYGLRNRMVTPQVTPGFHQGPVAVSCLVSLMLLVAALALASRVSADDFIVDLGALNYGCRSGAAGIHEHAQLVGSSDDGDGRQSLAFIWENGTMTDLG